MMTPHPEDAMTREQALLVKIDKLFDQMRKAIRAHANTQQEPAPAADAEEVVEWEYKTANGWTRISLENYKILKGSSFVLRPITRARAAGEKGGQDV